MLWPTRLLITSFLICVAGCASKQLASKDADGLAKQFNPPADKSFIYVLRRRASVGAGNSMSLALDGEFVGSIQNSTYILLELPPNVYEITVDNMLGGRTSPLMPVTIELETLPGRSYFVVTKFKTVSIGTEVVQNEVGEKLVRKYKRVVSVLDTN